MRTSNHERSPNVEEFTDPSMPPDADPSGRCRTTHDRTETLADPLDRIVDLHCPKIMQVQYSRATNRRQYSTLLSPAGSPGSKISRQRLNGFEWLSIAPEMRSLLGRRCKE